MDERLQAGRHHLLNGDRALQGGYPDDSRAHFEAALLQFRGPDLRLGEAHALRGMGQVEMAVGNLAGAETRLKLAIEGYQSVLTELERLDEAGVSHELRRDAQEGEGATMVLFGELMVRGGRTDEARAALGYAKEIFSRLGDVPSAAGVWNATARMAMHEGSYARAQECYEKALSVHQKSGNLSGQVGGWLALAELRRVQRDLVGAELALENGRRLAKQARNTMLEGRVMSSIASLLLQELRLDEAREAYQQALQLSREAGDHEMEGFALLGLGDAMSRTRRGHGLEPLLEGSRILSAMDHQHGLAAGLLRIAEHSLRVGAPHLALASAEGARRLYLRTDPTRGVGMAYRLIVKALAAVKEWQAVLAAAIAREAVAGSIQPNAREVAAFYRKRAPSLWVEELKPLGLKGMVERSEQNVRRVLEPALATFEVQVDTLSTGSGALAIVELLAAGLPHPADDAPAVEPAEPASGEGFEDDLEPEEEAYFQQGQSTPAALFIGTSSIRDVAMASGPDGPQEPDGQPAPNVVPDPSPADSADPEELPSDAIEPLTEEVPVPAPRPTEYDAFYDPPSSEQGPPPSEPTDADEQDEPAEVPEQLRRAPPPAEYADFYDPPGPDEEQA